MKTKYAIICIVFSLMLGACQSPQPVKKTPTIKNNFIILVDLSDRLIVENDQPLRDKEIIKSIYTLFEQKVKKDLYIKSRDEIKVVIAPQKGSGIQNEIYEDKLYVNMEIIKNVFRRPKEQERRTSFFKTLDDLYQKAIFSSIPKNYYGADIWKYFYEDLKGDISKDPQAKNYLFILTDGYPIVGKDLQKLQPVRSSFPDLNVILLEGSPRDKDMEWDRLMDMWAKWFDSMNIKKYTFVKRKAITKIEEQIKSIVEGKQYKN
jgi:hypothetical protein